MKTWKLLIALAILAYCISCLHQGLEKHRYTRARSDFSYLPSTEQVRLLSLGHTETVAGLIWIRGILYFGSSLMDKTDTKWMEHLIDLVTTTDPKFKEAYTFLGTAIDPQSITSKGLDIFEQGLISFPTDWQIGLYYAMIVIEQKQNYQKAATIMKQYSDLSMIPPHINRIHETFSRKDLPIPQALHLYLSDYLKQADPTFIENSRNRILGFLIAATPNGKSNISLRPRYIKEFKKFETKKINSQKLYHNLIQLTTPILNQ